MISQSKRPLHNHLFLSYLIIAIQNHTSGWPSHSHPNTEILREISLLPTGDPYYVSYSLIKETKNAKRLVHCIHLEASMGLRILPMVLHLLAATYKEKQLWCFLLASPFTTDNDLMLDQTIFGPILCCYVQIAVLITMKITIIYICCHSWFGQLPNKNLSSRK